METLSSDSTTSTTTPASTASTAPLNLNTVSIETREILQTMLRLLSFEAKLTPSVQNNAIHIEMECEDAGRIIGRKGATIQELQFLLNRLLQRRYKTVPRIFLDVNRAKEEAAAVIPVSESSDSLNEVLDRIKPLVDQVRRWGEPAEIGNFTAQEFQFIQETFSKDREIEVFLLSSSPSGSHHIRFQIKQKS